jgi:lipopolysaccharide transport system ATP-binding protein
VSECAISAEGLSKRYTLGSNNSSYGTLGDTIAGFVRARGRPRRERREMWAVRDVSFQIEQGEAVGFVGRNGAGKSTILKILSRITKPTKGTATLRGRVGSLLEVGTGFHGELTGRENVYLNGALLGLTRAEIDRRFDDIVEFAEMADFLDTPVKRYSTGMTVRLAFSVAAHLEPEILLVDEVLAVGDLGFQRKCLGKISEVASHGRTVLFVSHNMAVIQALCSRGIYLDHGRVHTDGPIEEAVGAYLRSLEEFSESLDLSDRADRKGLQEVTVREITIKAPDDTSGTLTSGRPADFTFHLSGEARKLSLLFTIHDQLGHPVTTVSTSQPAPQDVWEAQDHPHFECRIDSLALVPGRYRLDYQLFSGNEHQDHLEGAAFFDVVEGVVDGRPVSMGEWGGNLVLSTRWRGPKSAVQ